MMATSSVDVLRSQQDAARTLFEMSGLSTTPSPSPSSAVASGMGSTPLFLLPSLHKQLPNQLPNHSHLLPHLFMGGGLFMPNAFPLLPLATSSTSTFVSPTSPATSVATATSQQSAAMPPNNNRRLSVAYLLNGQDESPTTTETSIPFPFIKKEPEQQQQQPQKQPSQRKRKGSSSTSGSPTKAKRARPAISSSPASSSPPSSPPASSSTSTPSSPPAAAAATFKGDLSLFPHLQLQLQREQLDPQQHTELVLKVWNRQQQVLKLQQLQQKKQELKAQRLQQRLQRKSGKATASPGSPASGTGSTASSPSSTATSTALPPSPTNATPSADMVTTALPTIDDILNGVDAQVDETSDDDNADKNKKGKARRRITARQVAVLEQVFAVEPFPGPSTKKVIAKRLGMQERSITIWFQNKRARLKRIDGDSHHGQSSEGEGGRREVTFHNLAVGFDGKLDMLPEAF